MTAAQRLSRVVVALSLALAAVCLTASWFVDDRYPDQSWWADLLQGFGSDAIALLLGFLVITRFFEGRRRDIEQLQREAEALVPQLKSDDADVARRAYHDMDRLGIFGNFPLLHGIVLDDANLEGARLSGAQLPGVRLRGANLRRAHLRQASLRRADLERADLRRAELFKADLRDANLRGAQLQGASHREAADLQGARLQGADLEGADLRGVSLRWAKLRGARNLDKARCDAATQLPDTTYWSAPIDWQRFTGR